MDGLENSADSDSDNAAKHSIKRTSSSNEGGMTDP